MFKFIRRTMITMAPINNHQHCATESFLPKYSPPSLEYKINHVVVMHRHGDRSQLQRHIGTKYPESENVTKIWSSRLPTQQTLKKLLYIAKQHDKSDAFDCTTDTQSLYCGWDQKNIPYAQLTEIGVQQLISVGQNMRSRYAGSVIPHDLKDVSQWMYCRSTNMCRTIQSLRALLVGLLDSDNSAISRVPVILTRTKATENMYPQADGRECLPLTQRKVVVNPPHLVETAIPDYLAFEARMKALLGYQDVVPWMHATDVLTCHLAHGISHVKGLTATDVQKVAEISSWIWGRWFKDDSLNRLAIGKFADELLRDIQSAMSGPQSPSSSSILEPSSSNKKILIYSGHDSTLVPVLCALGLYNDSWPPYASHLALEVAEHKATGQHFVRAVYNDQALPMLGQSELWCPLSSFCVRLRSLALTEAEYDALCSEVTKD